MSAPLVAMHAGTVDPFRSFAVDQRIVRPASCASATSRLRPADGAATARRSPQLLAFLCAGLRRRCRCRCCCGGKSNQSVGCRPSNQACSAQLGSPSLQLAGQLVRPLKAAAAMAASAAAAPDDDDYTTTASTSRCRSDLFVRPTE
jgi:hypothetical protein